MPFLPSPRPSFRYAYARWFDHGYELYYTETALDWYWTHSMDLVAFPFNAEIYCKISCDTVLESADKNDLTKTHSPFCAILLLHKRRRRDTNFKQIYSSQTAPAFECSAA